MTEETNPFKDFVDTDNDGEVSKEELDNALDNLADLEDEKDEDESVELSAKDMVVAAHNATTSDEDRIRNEVVSQVAADWDNEEKEEVDTSGRPSVKKLQALHPKHANVEDHRHEQEWARHCSLYADNNKLHFLGMCVKSGEPMFKEVK